MTPFRRFYFAACITIVTWSFAPGIGIPVWRNYPIGDRTDIAVCSFIAAWLFAGRNSKDPQHDR